MPVYELYSKRQKRLRGELPDVFTYDVFPQKFKIQVINIVEDAIGYECCNNISRTTEWKNISRKSASVYKTINGLLSRECEEYSLEHHYIRFNRENKSSHRSVLEFLHQCNQQESVVDTIELCFQMINSNCRQRGYKQEAKPKISPDEAIAELNIRFKENGLGYQFENNQIIRVDSTYLHAEAVKPTLQLLSDPAYKGANEEFLKAHEHYRHQRYQECLNECLKALESTMKIICDRNSWTYNKNDTAKRLIKVCFDNELVPSYLQTQFNSLRSLIESGVPTVRNKNSGHGQGSNNVLVDEELASYALHLTASNILFLIKR